MTQPVTTTLWGMEYSIHDLPVRHKDDVQAVFPGLDLNGERKKNK